MSYLIKPTNTITGAQAPGIMSFEEKKDMAIYDAQKRSNLSKYDNWSFEFEVVHIRDRTNKNPKRYVPEAE